MVKPKIIETLRPILTKHEGETKEENASWQFRGWWERYSFSIKNLPADTRLILEDDARYIARKAASTTDQEAFSGEEFYGKERIRTGMVVGSVQSGKTASMLAVAAILLDEGLDILVVLAGTRVALWLQTYERLLNQLDGSDLYTAWSRSSERVLVPLPEDILSNNDRVDPYRYLRGARMKVKKALQTFKPIIFVIPKEDDHLLALSKFLAEHTEESIITRRGRPLKLVVLDDEADDASILDAQDGSRITPQFIQQIWSAEDCAPFTRHPNLYATYIAYTATPQANYLQRSHNPLAPRDFHAALRVPSDQGARTPRADTYHERSGLSSYYCGGEHYYERLRALPGDPCVVFPFTPGLESAAAARKHADVRWDMIGQALRSYFVAGALRLSIDRKKFSLIPKGPTNLEELRAAVPATHTMLYHPSALKEAQFLGAEDITRWCKAIPGDESGFDLSIDADGNPILEIDSIGLARRLVLEEPLWQHWIQEFSASASAIATLPGYVEFNIKSIPWEDVRNLLIDEVFPNVKIRVLNSDQRADDRPSFDPLPTDHTRKLWIPPKDIYTVFVAGNVLSRGLTVAGLATSLFARSAREPAADTQMQMQRWFGYRGSHLVFCRVFLYTDQLELFRKYHQNDLSLKRELLSHMDDDSRSLLGSPLILQGDSFWATSKIDTRRIPLHPGAAPAIRLVERSDSKYYINNLSLVQSLINDGKWAPLSYPDGSERGLIRSETLSLLELATILEKMRYSAHDPDINLPLSQRWTSLQRLLKLDEPLFRPPRIKSMPMHVEPNGCPYSIAAYLRLWDLALRRHDLPGMQPTDNASIPWSMLDLSAYRKTAPRFYVGLRYGSENLTSTLTFGGKPFRMMRRGITHSKSFLLDALWGSRNPTDSWKGDQAFDYHYHSPTTKIGALKDGLWRQRGEPGLMLFHPVVDPQTGKEIIAIGLVMPRGGPDHVAALRVTTVGEV